MRCENVRLKIDAYVAGELPPKAQFDFEEHLKTCEGCRHAAATVRRLTELGRTVAVPPVPEGFAQRVHALARQRAAGRAPALNWSLLAWWRMVSVPMRAAAAAVLVIGLATGVLMGWNTWQAPATPPPQVSLVDPLAPYNVVYLTDAPDGSLAQGYLALVSGAAQEGK